MQARQSSAPSTGGRGAVSVASGIFLTRAAGLIRQRVLAHYFGLGAEADAWSAAFRIPNLLQNGFDNQALSASFIPVYESLLARGDREGADRVAGSVAALLALVVAALVLLGVVATPLLVELIAPGFTGEKRELTTRLVRIIFPGTGLLVLSAWCVGVLNAHERFLLPYLTPIAWNAAMIAALVAFGGGADLPRLAVYVAWGSVIGSALQLALQLPSVARAAPHLRFVLDIASAPVRAIARTFAPILLSRGVDQIGAYVDQLIASLLGGAVAAITNAQTLSTLPISLFGMSVSAAELPALSILAGGAQARHAALRARLETGLRHIALFVVPSAMAFLALGDVVAALIFQTGRFTRADAVYMWGILAGSAVGLLASALGRLYASASYALGDARTPLNCAIVRLTLTAVLGFAFAIPLPRMLGIDPKWGAAGLTASAGIAGWVEMRLLRASLGARIGRTGLPAGFVARLWIAAAAAAATAWAVKIAIPFAHPVASGVVVLGVYGVVFFAVAWALRVSETFGMVARFLGGA